MGYDLYTDRFYTSSTLAVELDAINTTLTGTAMANRTNATGPEIEKEKEEG